MCVCVENTPGKRKENRIENLLHYGRYMLSMTIIANAPISPPSRSRSSNPASFRTARNIFATYEVMLSLSRVVSLSLP